VSRSETGGRRLGIVGAGDDRAAVAPVTQLIDRLGFDTVDAGPLGAGLELEPDGPVFGLSYSADERRRSSTREQGTGDRCHRHLRPTMRHPHG
jgi:predicted dinucleotide-binding enzyme